MRDDNCIFCKIAAGEIPSATVYEDERVRVILDMGPASKGHALILPKDHYADVVDASEKAPHGLLGHMLKVAAMIGQAQMKTLGAAGFNVVQNNGEAAGQTVHHLHIHVIPRYEGGPQMVAWKPGESTPEDLAATAEKMKGGLK